MARPANEAELRRLVQIADQTLETFREARSATADLAANTLATAAGIAVVIATSGMATPLVVALNASLVGGVTQALTRMGIDGAFNWEELPADVLTGAINAGTAALSMPANVTGAGVTYGVLRRVAGSAFGGGALGAGLPAVMRDNTWTDGFAVGTLRVTQAALTGGLASTALPTMIGAGVLAARRALPFVSRVMTYTGTTTANIYDASWVRGFVNGTQSIGTYLDTTLTGWSNKLDEIANRLIAATPNESEAATRQALREILASTNYNQSQRDFLEHNAMATLRAHRGTLPTVTLSAARDVVLDGNRLSMNVMKESVDALRDRVFTAAQTTGGITDAQLDNLANRLAALENPSEAAVRTELEAVLGAANVTPSMARDVAHWCRPAPIQVTDRNLQKNVRQTRF